MFGFIMTRNTESNQIAKMVSPFKIVLESMRGDNVMDFHLSRLFSVLATFLASPVIALDSFSSLTIPILSIRYSSTKTMNVSWIVLPCHVFGAAFLRATYILGVFKARWRDNHLFATIGAIYSYFLYATRPTISGDIFLKTIPIAILLVFALSSPECLFALWASFIFASLKFSRFVGIRALNTTKHIRCFHAIRFYFYALTAKITSGFDHYISQKVCPSWKSVLLFRQSVHSGHVLNKTSDLSNYLNTIIIPCAGLT